MATKKYNLSGFTKWRRLHRYRGITTNITKGGTLLRAKKEEVPAKPAKVPGKPAKSSRRRSRSAPGREHQASVPTPKWNRKGPPPVPGGADEEDAPLTHFRSGAEPMTSFRPAAILEKPKIKGAAEAALFSLRREEKRESRKMAESRAPTCVRPKMATDQRKVAAAAAKVFRDLAERMEELSREGSAPATVPVEAPEASGGVPEESLAEREASFSPEEDELLPGRLSPHHRSWGSWAEIPTSDSDVSTPAEADFSTPSTSPESAPRVPLPPQPSPRGPSPPLPRWVFGDEPALVKFMRDQLVPLPGKEHPPVPTAPSTLTEEQRRAADAAQAYEDLKAHHQALYGPRVRSYAENQRRIEESKALEAYYIARLDYPLPGEPPLVRRRATVCKFDKKKGYGYVMDCHTGNRILVNRRAVARSYLPKEQHTLKVGEIIEYTPVESSRGEWAAAVTRPLHPTQIPYAYFPSEDWDSDPYGLLPPSVKGAVVKEEDPDPPAMAPKFQTKSCQDTGKVPDVPEVLRPTPPVEVGPNRRAPTNVPGPTLPGGMRPVPGVPTDVPGPTPDEEVRSVPEAPTSFSVAQAAASNIVVTVSPVIVKSRVSHSAWGPQVYPLTGIPAREPRYISQPKKAPGRSDWEKRKV